MAVITASLIAVGAAVASAGAVAAGVATVATIGTIAAVVGGVGLALGVAGQITGNKTLTKIGTYLGAAAAGGGLGALAAQALNLAPAAASAGGNAVTGAAGGAGETASNSAPALADPSVGQQVAGAVQNTTIPDGVTGTATQIGQAAQASAPAATSGGGTQAAVGGANTIGQQITSSVPQQQGIPGVSIDNSAATKAPGVGGSVNDAYNLAMKSASQAPANPTIQAPIPPTQYKTDYTGLLALSGAPMIGSFLNGVFQGQAASNQMQIQTDQNAAQNKLAQQQIDLEKEKLALQKSNSAYAPLVSFRGGLISNPGKA